MIEESLLIKYHAKLKDFKKGDILFKNNSKSRYYYQIKSGEVKLYNISSEGKEFLQSIYSKNRGVGESAILGGYNHLVDCSVTKHSKIWILEKQRFLKLIKENNEVGFKLSKSICERLYYISLMAYENSIENSEHRIITLLNYLKKNIYNINEPFQFKVDLSRKEIGELTGLRVETVIRSIKKLEKNNQVKIINHKVYI